MTSTYSTHPILDISSEVKRLDAAAAHYRQKPINFHDNPELIFRLRIWEKRMNSSIMSNTFSRSMFWDNQMMRENPHPRS